MLRLENKTALVTGAAQGIGLAIMRAFLAEGARVIASDIDRDRLDAACADLGERVEAVRLDVREEAAWQALTGRLDGTLDILVNNAGVTGFAETPGPHDPEHLDLASWRAVMAVNLDGLALGCKYAISWMKARPSAAIVNIASRSGLVGIPRAAAYAASKAAAINHTRSVALYCAEEGYPIRCNAICPAAILTPMWEPMLGTGPAREAAMAAITADTPLRRFGAPEEVAEAALYLASDASAYVTGSALHLDGGLLAGSAAPPRPAES